MSTIIQPIKTVCGAVVTPASIVGEKHILGLGSCVTFDSFWKTTPMLTRITGMSSLSMASLPIELDDPIFTLENLKPWQIVELKRDFSSTIPESEWSKAEIVIIDLVAERFGVFARGGQIITINSASGKSTRRKRAIEQGFQFIPTWSDLHFELWKKSIDKLLEQLQNNCELILINKVFAASRDDHFRYTNLKKRLGFNTALRRMYAYLEKKDCVEIVKYKKADLISKRGHHWSDTPFHYVDSHYDVLHRKLDEIYK